jgi:hypothetical protein
MNKQQNETEQAGEQTQETVTEVDTSTFDALALLREALLIIPNPDDWDLAKSNIRQAIAILKRKAIGQ